MQNKSIQYLRNFCLLSFAQEASKARTIPAPWLRKESSLCHHFVDWCWIQLYINFSAILRELFLVQGTVMGCMTVYIKLCFNFSRIINIFQFNQFHIKFSKFARLNFEIPKKFWSFELYKSQKYPSYYVKQLTPLTPLVDIDKINGLLIIEIPHNNRLQLLERKECPAHWLLVGSNWNKI